MIVIIPVCKKDAAQALKLARWIKDLGSVKPHECVLAIAKGAHDLKLHEPIMEELAQAFRKADLYIVSDIDPPTWPRGANHSFIRVCKDVIQCDPEKYFLWLEPDAIPLHRSWLHDIEREYLSAGKPFMGAFVDLPDTKQHMSGIAVYRQVDLFAPNFVLSHEYAFDIVMADQVIPKAHFTDLIQHEWKPTDAVSLVRPGAAIFHQDKTGALIDHLRGGHVARGEPVKGILEPLETPPAPSAPDRLVHHLGKPREPLTVPELIAGLVDHSKKDKMAKGRIVRQLRVAGIIK